MATKSKPKKTARKKQAAKTGGRKTATRKKATETKPAVATKTSDDSQTLVVFAFRLTRAERDLIHQAAGSGKASKFVRSVALAAARGDVKAIEQAQKQVHKT